MNGRIYDDTLSRFVQANPIIQDPFKTESLNRYSYVWSNPLNAADPSGFSCRGNGAAGADNTCTQQQDAEESQKKEAKKEYVTYVATFSGGKKATLLVEKSAVAAFEKKFADKISGNSTNNSASDVGKDSPVISVGLRQSSATQRNQTPVAGSGWVDQAAPGDQFEATNIANWRPSKEYSGGEITVIGQSFNRKERALALVARNQMMRALNAQQAALYTGRMSAAERWVTGTAGVASIAAGGYGLFTLCPASFGFGCGMSIGAITSGGVDVWDAINNTETIQNFAADMAESSGLTSDQALLVGKGVDAAFSVSGTITGGAGIIRSFKNGADFSDTGYLLQMTDYFAGVSDTAVTLCPDCIKQ